MFRDFHVIDGKNESCLFFPETFKFYAVSMEDGKSLKRFLNEGTAIRNELMAILINEEKKVSVEMQPVDAEADSLCLYMAHDCNLSCTYCYNDGGRSVNPSIMMSEDVAETAFRRFFTKTGKSYSVSFYGGEPLLNFKTIKRAIEIGDALKRERGIRLSYFLTTNGTILTEEMKRLIKERISNVCISIDGTKEIHDLHRKGIRGSSYEKAVKNLNRLRGSHSRVTLRATVSGQAVSHLEEIVYHLSTLSPDAFSVSPVNTGSTNPAYISDENFEEFVRRFIELTKRHFSEIIDGTGTGFKYTFNVVSNLLTKRRFFRHCDAGKNPAITADGSIYACHGLVGIKDFYMGKVTENEGIGFQRIKETFAGLNVRAIDECRTCWARYLCGGSCYAYAYFNSGTFYKPDPRHCLLFKRNAEAVIREFLKNMNDPVKRDGLYGGIKKFMNSKKGIPDGE